MDVFSTKSPSRDTNAASSPSATSGAPQDIPSAPTSFSDTFSDSQQNPPISFVEVGANTFRQEDDPLRKALSIVPALVGFRILNFAGSTFDFNPKGSVSDLVVTAARFVENNGLTQKVSFQVDGAVPMDIVIEKTNHKFNITISLSAENKERLSSHMPELSQLISKRLDQSEIQLSLKEHPQFGQGHGSGQQSNQQQSKSSSDEEPEERFVVDIAL